MVEGRLHLEYGGMIFFMYHIASSQQEGTEGSLVAHLKKRSKVTVEPFTKDY